MRRGRNWIWSCLLFVAPVNVLPMRYLRRLASVLVLVIATPVLLLLAVQDKMIYHPRPYPFQVAGSIGPTRRVEPLAYSSSQGSQQCYFVPGHPDPEGRLRGTVWVVFCGNASLALEWLQFVNAFPLEQDSFLLMDYPGFGACAGHPTPETIQESANKALDALALHLGVPVKELELRLNVLGHSLGAASALGFASKHPVSRIVLIAPFSSLQDMARRSVGWPLCLLLLHDFDNRARIREITTGTNVPDIEILAGTRDEVIPFTMGQELASISPRVHFEAVDGAGHNDILTLAYQYRIFAAMMTKQQQGERKSEALPGFR